MRRTRPGSPIDSAFTSRYLREIVVCRFESSRCSRDENGGGATGDDDFVDLDHPNSHHFSFVKREDKSPKIARERTREREREVKAIPRSMLKISRSVNPRKSSSCTKIKLEKTKKKKERRQANGYSDPSKGKVREKRDPFFFRSPSLFYRHLCIAMARQRRPMKEDNGE